MIYIYDIMLNFFSDKVFDFYEWDKSDKLDHIKRIPLLKVNTDVIKCIYEYNTKINENFASKIFNLTEVYTSRSVSKIPYCCLLCDGFNTIAIKLDRDGNVKYKSKLLLDEEDEILCISQKLNVTDINCSKGSKIDNDYLFTRNEIKVKNYLLKEIKNIYNSKLYDELKYLFSEYFEESSNDINFVYNKLISSITNESSEKQNDLYNLLQLIGNKN